MEWAFAICLGRSVDIISRNPDKLVIKGKNNNTPITLIVSWVKANLLDESDDPMAASIPVMHVPTLAPRIIATAAFKVIRLLIPRDITKPIIAELL
jgi:hypothetical protein